jgi:PAS domain S-box-containing protein
VVTGGEPSSVSYVGDYVVAVVLTRPWEAGEIAPDPRDAAGAGSMFVIDASVQAWRRGSREPAVHIGGSMAAFILVAGVHTPLVDAGKIETPYMISFAFMLIVMAQTYTFARAAVRAPELAREVEHGQRRWELFIDSVHLAVIEFDVDGIIRFVNPHFLRLTGYAREDVLDGPIERLIDRASVPEFRERLQIAAQVGPRPVSQWSILVKGGDASTFLWSSVPLRDLGGEITGFLTVGTDLTDQLKAQRELRTTQREMDRLVRAGMLGELSSTLAHELNQPLAAILSNAQAGRLLLKGEQPDPSELGEILEDIVLDGKRAGEVIHGLRAILRKDETESGEIDVAEAIAEVHRMVRGDFQASGIELDIRSGKPLPPVHGSKVQLEQVLLNLLLNALHSVQATERTPRMVSLQTRVEGGRLEFIVADTGVGVPEGKLSTVFEPFYTTRESGLGMGLAITRRIVEAHGGRIGVRNRDAVGAEFTFWIPLSQDAEAAYGS